MPVRVLVVDDSGFFRRRLTEMLEADRHIEVVGTAADGKEAIRKASELKPDVITMDIEMPVMDGITAVRRIMAIRPLPILMFSSLTHDGAQATLDALDAGAADFLPKKFEDISRDRGEAKRTLQSRVKSLAIGGRDMRAALAPAPISALKPGTASSQKPEPSVQSTPVKAGQRIARRRGGYELVAIGTSTGGPVALQKVLTALPKTFPLPVVLVQHMPASFTPAFASRLDQLCEITVKEAANGDTLAPGTALLAPGGKQMIIERVAGRSIVKITESTPEQNYRPCVDVTFSSIAKVHGGNTLAIILTGMGADGREGCKDLKDKGSSVWAQDEATSVIYGMPQAVVQAGIANEVLALPDIGNQLAGQV